MPRNATRSFEDQRDAEDFAKEVNGSLSPLDTWNPMRDFGYRWEVNYNPDQPGKEAPSQD